MYVTKEKPGLQAAWFTGENWRIRQLGGAFLGSEQTSNTDLRIYFIQKAVICLDSFIQEFGPQSIFVKKKKKRITNTAISEVLTAECGQRKSGKEPSLAGLL